MDMESKAVFIGIREPREYISLRWTLIKHTCLSPSEKIYLQM